MASEIKDPIEANALPSQDTPTSEHGLILINEETNVGERINYDKLADAILNKLTEKKYTIGTSNTDIISALTSLNSRSNITRLTIEPTEGITISSSSRAYLVGNVVFLWIKAKCVADSMEGNILTISPQIGWISFDSSNTFAIGLGTEWDITAAGYGFASGNGIIARPTKNQWLHICAALPCEVH